MENTGDTGITAAESSQHDAADTSADTGDTGNTGLDINAAVDSIGDDLFGHHNEDGPQAADAAADVPEDADTQTDAADDTQDDPDKPAAADDDIAPPQSWAKDKHELWKQMPKEAKEYYQVREKQMLDGLQSYKEAADFGRPLKEVITPYMPMIQARGIDAPKAVAALLNAQYRLDQNPRDGLVEIAKSYGIDLEELATLAGTPSPQVDPAVKALQDELHGIKSTLTAGQQQAYQQAQTKVAAEVNAFADDPAHPYFNEVATDIVAMLKNGEPLPTAYEKAVWANPVTRAKELARVQTENAKKLREENQRKVEAAKKASSTNVRNRDTRRAPTEQIGTMEDTMKQELARIKGAVH